MPEKKLKTSDRIDDLLDRVHEICLSRPVYLRPESITRYVALLNKFRQYHLNHWQHWRDPKTDGRRAGELHIQQLKWALETWVMSYFETGGCCLLPTYAMDTASMINHHVYGFRNAGLVSEALVDGGNPYGRFPESRFKGYFTGAMDPILVQAQVPANAYIPLDQLPVKDAGAEVLFLFKRCHLSQSAEDDDAELIPFDPADPRDLMREFWLNGAYLVSKPPYGEDGRLSSLLLRNFMLRSTEELDESFYPVPGVLPGAWIKAGILASNRKVDAMMPVPDWTNF